MLLAVVGQFRPFQTLRFSDTFQTDPIPPLTSPCSPNFAPFLNHPKCDFSFFCVCTVHITTIFFSIFQFLVVFRPNGPRAAWETWPFQYRTPRSRPVIPSPRSFSAENAFLTQLFGNFPLSFFLRVARRAIQLCKLSAFSQPRWAISLLIKVPSDT